MFHLLLLLSLLSGGVIGGPLDYFASFCNQLKQHGIRIDSIQTFENMTMEDKAGKFLCILPLSYMHSEIGCYSDSSWTLYQRLIPLVKELEENFERSRDCSYNYSLLSHYYAAKDKLLSEPWLWNQWNQWNHCTELECLPMYKISRMVMKLLKSLNTDVEAEKRLIREAVDTVFFTSSVNVYDLFLQHLRNQNNESKMLLKMVLTKYISKYVTTDYWQENSVCILQMFKGGLPDVILKRGGMGFQQIIDINSEVIVNHGPVPYIELALALVDQLDNFNIHEIISSQYANFIKIQELIKRYDLSGELRKIKNALTPLDEAFKNMICKTAENPGIYEAVRKMLSNMQSEHLKDQITLALKDILDVFSAAGTKLEDFINFKHDDVKRALNITSVGNFFTWNTSNTWVGPFPMTTYLMNNKGVMEKLFSFEIQDNDIKQACLIAICETMGFVVNVWGDLWFRFQTSENSPILLKGISLTAQEKNVVQKPFYDFKDFYVSLCS